MLLHEKEMIEMQEALSVFNEENEVEINVTKFIIPASNDANLLDRNDYEQFLTDIWVAIVLTFMVLSCVCVMCICLVYHKFQQWKSRVIEARNQAAMADLELYSTEADLPSYPTASGLPSYEDALEQLKSVKRLHISTISKPSSEDVWIPHTPPTPQITNNTFSVSDLFQYYNTKTPENNAEFKPRL